MDNQKNPFANYDLSNPHEFYRAAKDIGLSDDFLQQNAPEIIPAQGDSYSAQLVDSGLDTLGSISRFAGSALDGLNNVNAELKRFVSSNIVGEDTANHDVDLYRDRLVDSVSDGAKSAGRGLRDALETTATGSPDSISDAYKHGDTFDVLREAGQFIASAGADSLPVMAGLIAAPVPTYAGITQDFAENRAANDGRSAENPSLSDFAVAAPTAGVVAALERFGAGNVLKPFLGTSGKASGYAATDALGDITGASVANAIKETGKNAGRAAVIEGATEFSQQLVQDAGEQIGTERGYDFADSVEGGLWSALAGAGVGGGLRGSAAPVDYYRAKKTLDEYQGDNIDLLASDEAFLSGKSVIAQDQAAFANPEIAPNIEQQQQPIEVAQQDYSFQQPSSLDSVNELTYDFADKVELSPEQARREHNQEQVNQFNQQFAENQAAENAYQNEIESNTLLNTRERIRPASKAERIENQLEDQRVLLPRAERSRIKNQEQSPLQAFSEQDNYVPNNAIAEQLKPQLKAKSDKPTDNKYDIAYNLPKNTVVGTPQDVVELAKPKNRIKQKKIRLSVVQGKEAKRLTELTGVNLDGYKHVVDTSGIRHAFKHHGDAMAESKRGQIAIKESDFSKISEIISNPDKVELSGKDKLGNDLIKYQKQVDDGTTYYVEEIRTGRKELVLKSMWRARTASVYQQKSSPPLTSETSQQQAATDKSIAQNTGNKSTDDDTRFSVASDAGLRINKSITPTNSNASVSTGNNGTTITKADASKVVDRVVRGWSGGSARKNDFVVASNFNDLPDAIKNAAKRQKAEGQVRGVFHNGKTYLVADQLGSPKEAEQVIFHETYGHHGIRKVFGQELPKKLNQLHAAIGGNNGVQRITKKHNIDLSQYQDGLKDSGYSPETQQQIMVDELLAHLAQDNKPSVKRLVKEVLGTIRQGLKKLGLVQLNKVSDNELFAILRDARKAVQQGKGSTGNSDIRFSLASDTRKAVAKKVVRPVAQAFDSKYGLYARMTDQIVESKRDLFMDGDKSLLDSFSDNIQRMQAYRNNLLSKAEKQIEEKWDLLDPQTSQRLSNVMLEATMQRVDAAKAFKVQPIVENLTQQIDDGNKEIATLNAKEKLSVKERAQLTRLKDEVADSEHELGKLRNVHTKLAKDFAALGKKGQDQYIAVRDFYVDLWQEQHEALQQRIDELGLDKRNKAKALTQVDEMFLRASEQGVYFPLARFGDYVVIAKDKDTGKVVARYQYASKKEARAAEAKLRKEQPDLLVLRDLVSETGGKSNNISEYAKTLISKIEKLSDEHYDKRHQEDAAQVVPTDTAYDLYGLIPDTEVMDLIYQTMLRSLPANSAGKQLIHRKYIKGASSDQRRAFAHTAFHTAIKISRIKYDHKVSKAISDMDALVSEDTYSQENKEQARVIVDHVRKIHDSNMNPNGSRFASAMVTGAFMMHLAVSPAAGLINMSQTFLIGIPWLGSRYGIGRTMSEIGKLSADFGKQAWNNKSGFSWKKAVQADAWVSLVDSPKLSDNYKQLLKELHTDGTIEITQMQAMAQLAETDMREKATYSRNTIKAIRGAGSVFHNAEIFNREVVALAAMKLYAEDYGKSNNGKQPTNEQMKVVAQRAVRAIHFDYSSENRAYGMRGNVQKMLFVFKTYSQNIINLLLKDFARAIDGSTKQERRQHAKELTGILTAHFMAGGLLALPLIGVLSEVTNTVLNAISDDDEHDVIAEMRTAIHEISPPLEGVLFRGSVNTALGIDLSNRIKLDGLLWRSPSREMQGQEKTWHYIEETFGAVFGTWLKVIRGIDTFGKGIAEDDSHKTIKGFTTAVPKFIADPSKAIYRMFEGEKNFRGDELMAREEFINRNVWRSVAQSMGFSPAKLTDIYDRNNAISSLDKRLGSKRQVLITKIINAMRKNRNTRELWEEASEFSSQYPEYRITPKQVMRSYRAKAKRGAQTDEGLYKPRTKSQTFEKYQY
ncbi:PLxRFG domain-containing protein [Endozoicomonas sp. G2_1]|uniref:PLxRFG domain-containing protein n=1 Tax=Endozoicomonas sp. G2_1 TaxID=2821091 RepID=UPI001ADD0170|nr:PLxRFG domain-containing protein [Endozoicomonas sp. G2_1]MBO9492060.1 PLxRFG domain-containing protein [Endozoicomonas sp. G2_1]